MGIQDGCVCIVGDVVMRRVVGDDLVVARQRFLEAERELCEVKVLFDKARDKRDRAKDEFDSLLSNFDELYG